MLTTVNDIAASIMKSHDAVGLLMYGSAVTGIDSAADVDVICVTRNKGHRHFITTVQHRVVDVYADTRESLKTSIGSDKRDNNNFILNAFVHGRSLFELDNSIDALSRVANEVWQAGPAAPTGNEIRAIEVALTKGLNAARSYATRADLSVESRGIATLSLGQIFLRAMYAYCRINRLWSSTVSDMLGWKDPRYAELINLIRQHFRAESVAEQLGIVNELTGKTISFLKNY